MALKQGTSRCLPHSLVPLGLSRLLPGHQLMQVRGRAAQRISGGTLCSDTDGRLGEEALQWAQEADGMPALPCHPLPRPTSEKTHWKGLSGEKVL